MDLRQLRCFVSVARHNGFRRGASALNLAQPAVSRHIKQLEESLGAQLFYRANGGAKLTEAGTILLRHAEEVFDKLAQIRDDLDRVAQRTGGAVNVGAPSSIGQILIAPLADRLRRQAPDIRLTFTESACRLLELLQAGQVDLAVFSCTQEPSRSKWVCERLVCERVYLIGRRDSLPGAGAVAIEEVVAMPLILTPLPNAQHQYLCDCARRLGSKLNVVAEAESMNGLIALVDRGLGYAVLPFSAAALVSRASALGMCEIAGFHSWRMLVRRADRALSLAGQKVWSAIISEMQALQAAGAFGPPVIEDRRRAGSRSSGRSGRMAASYPQR